MKKVTIITMQLKTPGGIERFITTLATMLSDDYSVEIVSNYGKKEDKLAFPLPRNVKLTFLTPVQPKEVSMKDIIKQLKWHTIPSELARRKSITTTQNQAFKNYLQNLETDFIITDRALYSQLVTKYYHGRAKKIATDHNHHQNNPKYIKELSNSLRNFNTLIVATEELKNYYQHTFQNIDCYVIPNPLAQIPAKKSPLKSNHLVAVGRFVPEKDFSTLIEVMNIIHKQLPDAHLTIIGDGKELPSIKAKVKSYHLENVVSLPGWLPQDKIEKYYYDSSLFVMTSKTEAFGLVLAEAMSFGLPCIAFDRASGAKNQLKNDIGFLIHSASSSQMANKIIELLKNKPALQAKQTIINHNIQKYSIKTILKEWEKILK